MAKITVGVAATGNFGQTQDLGEATIDWDMVGNKIYFFLSQFPALTDWPKHVKVSDETDGVQFGMRQFEYRPDGEIQRAVYRTTVADGAKLWLHIVNDQS